jgi:hypothetical protein
VRTERDPDLLLIERMLAPPPLEDCRSSLEFWERRGRNLPLFRVAARREASRMVVEWKERVRSAEQAAFEARGVGRFLKDLGVPRIWLRRARLAQQVLIWFARVITARRVRPAADNL